MKTKLFTIAMLTLLVAPVSTMAGDGNFYIKGNIGAGMPLDSDVDNLPGVAGSAEMSFDTGFIGSLAAGYDFSNPFRIEIESLIRNNDLDSLSREERTVAFDGADITSHSFLLNGFYDIDTGTAWTPFAGIGIGGSRLKLDGMGLNNDDTDPVFTYQFIGGVAYKITDNLSMDAQYRYIGTADAQIDGANNGTVDSAEFDYSSNNLMLGLRYTF